MTILLLKLLRYLKLDKEKNIGLYFNDNMNP